MAFQQRRCRGTQLRISSGIGRRQSINICQHPTATQPGQHGSGEATSRTLPELQALEAEQAELTSSTITTLETTPSGDNAISNKNIRCHYTNCSKAFASKRQLANHIRRHTLPRACPHSDCTARFADRKDMLRHVSRAHPTHDPEHLCPAPRCGRTFPGWMDALQRHIRGARHAKRFGTFVIDAAVRPAN